MVKSFIILAVLAASSAFASEPCADRFNALKGQRWAIQVPNKSTYNALKSAFTHYTEVTGAEPVLRRYAAFYNTAYGQVTGYRYLVAAKNKTSNITVEYYADNTRKIVFAKAGGTSIQEYWICEPKPAITTP